MGSYTMELREYIESWTQNQTGLRRDDVIEAGRTHLFDFNYPFYDESKRKDFETDFIKTFYMRELGFETEGLFKFRLENWLNINMPYWNKIFESELLQFDPLSNTKVDNTHNKTNDSTAHVSGSTTSTVDETDTVDNFRRNLDSDTPDTRLAITTNDGQGVIEYATNIQEENENDTRTNNKTANDSGSSDSTNNQSENFSQHREGKIGVQSYSKMLKEYRQVLLRVEKQIFEEMNELFMLVY